MGVGKGSVNKGKPRRSLCPPRFVTSENRGLLPCGGPGQTFENFADFVAREQEMKCMSLRPMSISGGERHESELHRKGGPGS